MNYAIIFFVIIIALTIAGREGERNSLYNVLYDNWVERTELRNEGLSFEEGMKKIDSLWTVIQEWDIKK